MPRYIDGFVIPIKKKNLALYEPMARTGAKLWTEHGALEYFECFGDDLKIPYGAGFPRQMKLKRGETVILAFIVFRSRAHRDKVNARVMKDPRMSGGVPPKMPFDMKRMLYGGFEVLLEARARKRSR